MNDRPEITQLDVTNLDAEAVLNVLQQKGALFSIDADFGRLLARLEPSSSALVPVLGALASHAVQTGHVCFDLDIGAQQPIQSGSDDGMELQWPAREQVAAALGASALVNADGDTGRVRPLVLDRRGRIYLHRYAAYQARLIEQLAARQRTVSGVDEALLASGLARFFGAAPESVGVAASPDMQRVACALAVRNHFTVISGGPGTGKTTTVAKVLLLLLEQAAAQSEQPPRFALLAPTGKAAQRLGSALLEGIARFGSPAAAQGHVPMLATTIHRALGFNRRTPTRFHHGIHHPLGADVVVVDEASMVDLALMTKLVEAVAPHARLILLGDKDQLASVEAGAIFGDIFNPTHDHRHSPATVQFQQRVGAIAPRAEPTLPLAGEPLSAAATDTPGDGGESTKLSIVDCTVGLTRSYRYAGASGIGKLASAVREGDPTAIEAALMDDSARRIGRATVEPTHAGLDPAVLEAALSGYTAYAGAASTAERIECLRAFRVLCATRRGTRGVEGMNQSIETALAERGLLDVSQGFYAGRPLIVTENDHALGLFNGDIGIVDVDASTGRTVAVFEGTTGLRPVQVSRLPAHETVFAMTVHKSQGSEFDQVLLVLPETPSPVLSRELLYTGITRARRSVAVCAPTAVLHFAAKRRVERSSGLGDGLWETARG